MNDNAVAKRWDELTAILSPVLGRGQVELAVDAIVTWEIAEGKLEDGYEGEVTE